MESDFRIVAATVTMKPDRQLMDCIEDAIEFSKHAIDPNFSDLGPLVTFEFSGTQITVRSDSDPEVVCRIYQPDQANIVDSPPPSESKDAETPDFTAEVERQLHEAFYDS